MRLKQYLEYKSLDLPWIDNIPSHWDMLRAKCLFRQIDIRSESGEEELLSVSEKKGVTPRTNVNVTMFKAESYQGYKLCWPGDLVINSLWAWMQGLGFSRYHGIISTAYGVYRIKDSYKVQYKYFDYLFRSVAYLWELRVRSKGIWRSRYQLTDDAFLTMPVIVPTENEQKQIVKFLDFKSVQIAKFIRNKRRFIQLLTEQKQGIINQAVTRGINPEAKMKSSGIDWLGEIPNHWEVRKLKTIARMKSGENITSMGIEEKANYPVYGGNGIRGYSNEYTHEGIYLLVGRQGALCGNVHFVEGKFWASEHAVVTTVNKDFCIKWYFYMLIVMNLNQYSESAAQPGISVERIQRLRTGVPPRKEQEKIVSYIEELSAPIEKTISYAKREIELIQEYRTRLISDVVTGKVDVRDIKVEDIAEDKLLEDVSDTEESEEVIDSIEEVSVED